MMLAVDRDLARRLQALGVVPYVLRSASPPPAALPAGRDTVAEPAVAGGDARCVLVLPGSSSSRHQDLIGRAMHALGADFARAPCVRVGPTGIGEPPPRAAAYVAFGEAQARALGHVLSGEAMRQAEVVLLDAPENLHGGAAKRQLWLALKALRRRLREH